MMQRGFTLVEMLLSVGLIATLAALSLPLYATFVNKDDLDLTTQVTANALRRAQLYSRAAKGDSAWGVAVTSGAVVMFEGATYASRDTTADETNTIPGSITPSGSAEVDFAKLTGVPAATASITLTSNTNDTRTITVNAKGMVDY